MRRAWVGKTVVAIALVHAAFGLIGLRATFSEIVADGLWNTVNGQPEREFAFWFVAFGLLALILGALIDHVERTPFPMPRFLGWSLLALTVVMLLIVPVSGAWLVLIPAIGAIGQGRGR